MPLEALLIDAFGTILHADPPWEGERERCLAACLAAAGDVAPLPRFVEAYEAARARQHAAVSESHREFDFEARFEDAFFALGVADARILGRKAALAYMDFQANLVRAFDGAPAVLDELSKEFRLALVSNYPDGPALRGAMEREKLLAPFEVVIVSGEHGWMKPHETIFTEALAKLGLPASRACMIGNDVECDILPARKLGLRTVWTPYPRDADGTAPADATARSWREVARVVRAWR
ncbi:MAG TPA: HAD family hydrolase [Candidatus Thermoplasmatota archaeon]|nr:HAD family hydrolase [Candidatus Thermoplasmatota archaeon]